MKKLLLLALFAACLQMVQAQDTKKLMTLYTLKKYDESKAEIDRLMADPKSNTKEGWYWKSKVYAAVYQDSLLRVKYPGLLKETDDAFKKYVELDPGFTVVKLQGSTGPDGYFNMYKTTYVDAIRSFNAKKWDDASANFTRAVGYSDYIFTNKWSTGTYAFDTTSLLYLGYAYQNAGKMDDAARTYTRLADAKATGEGFEDVYKFLVNYNTEKKNEAAFKKYLATARELYPKNAALWDEFAWDYMDKNSSLEEKKELYDKADAAGTLTEIQYLQYGDLFVNAKNKDKTLDSLTQLKYSMKGAEAFKKAYSKNSQGAIAAFNVGVIYYNIFGEYDDRYAANVRSLQAVNTNKPAPDKDPKKKAAQDAKLKEQQDVYKNANAAIEKPIAENLDLSIDWLEKAYTAIKGKADMTKTDKSIANKSVDFLANLYAYKRDRARGKDPKAFDMYDAKYKEYDGLHGKF